MMRAYMWTALALLLLCTGCAMINESGVSFAANDFGVGASVSLAVDTISVVEDETP